MTRPVMPQQLTKQFRAVNPHEAAEREPYKYWDPFIERDDGQKERA